MAKKKATKKAAKKPMTVKAHTRTKEFTDDDLKCVEVIDKTAKRIEREINRRVLPELKFPVRSLSNVSYDKKVGYFQIGSGTKSRHMSVNTVKNFAQTLRLMAVSKEMVENDDFATKREAYYVSKNWGECKFNEQTESDSVMDDIEALASRVRVAVKYLDRVVDINYYPTEEAAASNARWRPIGLGLMGLQDVFFLKRLAFDSPDAAKLSARIQEEIYYAALCTSADLAEQYGPHDSFSETRAAAGVLQFDLWGVTPDSDGPEKQVSLFSGARPRPGGADRWGDLKKRIQSVGLRNSLLVAIAPTATIASISGCYECTEPQVSNLFKRETLSGEFMQINRYLVADLKRLGLWTPRIRELIKGAEGSIQGIREIPEELRRLYRTAWELPQRAIIDMAAARSPYIDQSASLNLFMAEPTIGKLSSMYAYAWKKGLKTTYYLRSRPATRIARATGSSKKYTDEEALACSLENPEYCEACQ